MDQGIYLFSFLKKNSWLQINMHQCLVGYVSQIFEVGNKDYNYEGIGFFFNGSEICGYFTMFTLVYFGYNSLAYAKNKMVI
jgi:hypothetical protein